jgi:hypothetical protein
MNARVLAENVFKPLPLGTPLLLALMLALSSGCGDSPPRVTEMEQPKVCGFKEGHGVFVREETREAIQLQVADAVANAATGLLSVPQSSLLSTATGDFVFTVNGDHFQRTAIKIAGWADGRIGVSDGLLEGDQVVTNGVRELWRIELQATKGGYACCAVEKKE